VSLPAGAPRPDHASYLTEVAASAHGQAFRGHVLAALDLRPGQTALDVGCGPGVNLGDLAAGVGPAGTVIAVDLDPGMAARARRQALRGDTVGVLAGDGHALPVRDASVDRARVDRVLQHVTSPAQVIAELRRVSRPGGLVALAEPDWATLAIDATDLATSAGYTRYVCARVIRNPCIGRQLARLAAAAGFAVRSVQALAPVFTDFGEADRLLGLTRVSERAVTAGEIPGDRAGRWLAGLRQQPFLATFTVFSVIATVPPLPGRACG
jgi:ubiquinone/menaquinone biosynthesis C-methylase UbiE